MTVTDGGATLPDGSKLHLCTAEPNSVGSTLKNTARDGDIVSDFAGANWSHTDQVQYGSNGLHGGMWDWHKAYGCDGTPLYH